MNVMPVNILTDIKLFLVKLLDINDIDGAVARENFEKITIVYYDVFYKFKMIAEWYFEKGIQEECRIGWREVKRE